MTGMSRMIEDVLVLRKTSEAIHVYSPWVYIANKILHNNIIGLYLAFT